MINLISSKKGGNLAENIEKLESQEDQLVKKNEKWDCFAKSRASQLMLSYLFVIVLIDF
jgi:hypothetical protein